MDTQGKSGIDIKTVEDAIRLVEASKLTHIKVGLSDVDGILRGKYLRKDKFVCALRSGFAFCSVVLGWDADDQMYDNASYTGWHTAYPDAQVRIIPQSCRRLPLEIMNGEPMLFFLAEFAGDAEDICPRGVLRRVINAPATWATTCIRRWNTSSSCSRKRLTACAKRTTRTSRAGRPGTSAIRSCAAR